MPENMRDPDVATSLEDIVHGMLMELHTAMPAKIHKVHSPGKVDVKPLLKRVYLDDEDREVESEYPVVTNVPVMNLRGGGAFISVPLKAGDPVVLIIAERSLDLYLETDGSQVIDPQDGRRHNVTDAWCFPGGATFKNKIPNAHADDLVIGLEDGKAEVHVKPGGHLVLKGESLKFGSDGASHPVAYGDGTASRLGAIESWISSAVSAINAVAGQLPNGALPPFVADLSDVTSSKVSTD